MTKSQIDRLGERLKKGNLDDADLRLLDEYRRSFTHAYESVVNVLRDPLAFEPTGRPAKSTSSIVDKLRRESIRLSQIQDIAGCRIVVDDIATQEESVDRLRGAFPKVILSDRRGQPSNGYRAVHVIVETEKMLIEVQVRTVLQHLWAQLSEKLSDAEDPTIKYGGGPEWARTLLSAASGAIAQVELVEMMLLRLRDATPQPVSLEKREKAIGKYRDSSERLRRELAASLEQIIARRTKG